MGHRRLLERLQSPVVAFPLSLVAALATCLALESATGSLETAAMVAITVFCIGLWILTPIPPAYTGVLGIGLLAVVFSPAAALTAVQPSLTDGMSETEILEIVIEIASCCEPDVFRDRQNLMNVVDDRVAAIDPGLSAVIAQVNAARFDPAAYRRLRVSR